MHIPACLVINKIDLIENRADLLKLTEILTDGTIAGEKIQKKSIGLGIVGSIISKEKNEMDKYNLSDNNNEFLSLHPHTTKERDEHWYSLYNKILSKPLHKARWTDTRKLFKEQNGWPHFKAVFFTSAKTNEGIDVLRTYLREHSIDKKWSFSPQTVSKKNSRLLCAEHVRSALLDNCPPHIAYKLRVAVTEWEFDEQLPINEQILKVAVNVFCENEREARQVWYQMEEIENTICQQLQQLYCRNALFRLFIRVKDKGGIYQPDEKAEERKRLFKEEMRIKKEI
ncbi:G domain-containing protein [Meloidogyne graminicola]|uniref:G domain-containing protein n=1 Tax=Meloidogyne graminicola TaxID=189291 RepID=A0A8S9ZN09_9BILA|nr:G domain-containing protein [Meloidogyne graminicola]